MRWELEFAFYGDVELSVQEFSSLSTIIDFAVEFEEQLQYWSVLLNGKKCMFN